MKQQSFRIDHNQKYSGLVHLCQGKPYLHDKQLLWSNLKSFLASSSGPSLVVGYFNDILNLNDIFGGLKPSEKKMQAFRKNLDECNLLDLGFSGPRFTWSNLR